MTRTRWTAAEARSLSTFSTCATPAFLAARHFSTASDGCNYDEDADVADDDNDVGGVGDSDDFGLLDHRASYLAVGHPFPYERVSHALYPECRFLI